MMMGMMVMMMMVMVVMIMVVMIMLLRPRLAATRSGQSLDPESEPCTLRAYIRYPEWVWRRLNGWLRPLNLLGASNP